MRTLIVARHGRTAWNLAHRFQGHTDIPLDDEGRMQARALAEQLREERIDRAVCSDLSRARETAEIILAGRGIPLTSDPDWREMRFGSWEGLTWEEITAAYPELTDASKTQCERYTPEGGESFDALCERVRGALDRLEAALPPEGRGFVATHAGPLHALLRVLKVMSEEESLRVIFTPGSVTRFSRSEQGWEMG